MLHAGDCSQLAEHIYSENDPIETLRSLSATEPFLQSKVDSVSSLKKKSSSYRSPKYHAYTGILWHVPGRFFFPFHQRLASRLYEDRHVHRAPRFYIILLRTSLPVLPPPTHVDKAIPTNNLRERLLLTWTVQPLIDLSPQL